MSNHKAINPRGEEILLPMCAIDALSALHLIERPNGIPHITSGFYCAVLWLEHYDRGPQPLRGTDYRKYLGGKPAQKNGRISRFLAAVGTDCCGVSTWVQCTCDECRRKEEDADRTRMPYG